MYIIFVEECLNFSSWVEEASKFASVIQAKVILLLVSPPDVPR
jgi:hypothetical protein